MSKRITEAEATRLMEKGLARRADAPMDLRAFVYGMMAGIFHTDSCRDVCLVVCWREMAASVFPAGTVGD